MVLLMGFFRGLIDAWDRRKTLQELRSFETTDKEERYWAFRFEMKDALELCDRDLVARAKEVWEQARARFPEQPIKSDLAVNLLLRLRMYDEVEDLLKKGVKKFPREARFLEGLAQASYDQDKMEEALGYCRKIQKKFPISRIGYALAGASLSRLGRPKEAEAELAKAFRQMPGDAGLLIEHAKFAERREDWATALIRWNNLYQAHKHPAAIAGAAINLAKLGRFEEAEQVIEDVRYRFGNEPHVWMAHAQLAMLRSDMQTALDRWGFFQGRFPNSPFGYIESFRILEQLGRLEDAEATLSRGLICLPQDIELCVHFAHCAHRRAAWQEAADRWEVVRRIAPMRKDGYVMGAEALAALGHTESAGIVGAAVPKAS